MLSFLKYLFILLLFLLCSCIIGLFAYLTLTQAIDFRAVLAQPKLITTSQLIALCSLVLVPTSLVLLFAPLFQITPQRSRLSSFLSAVLILLMISFIGYQLADGRKVYQPYAQKDLIVRHPDATKASFLLSSLLNRSLGPIPATGRMEDVAFYQQIEVNRQEIETAWKNIASYRVVVDQLAEFSVLPHPLGKVEAATAEEGIGGLRDICRIYLAHSLLQINLGNRAQGIVELTTIHRVAGNGLAGSLRMSEKMAWAAALDDTMRAAYQIAVDPQTSYDETKQLAAACRRLTQPAVSLRNVWLSEYLNANAKLNFSAAQSLAQQFPAGTSRPLLLQISPPWLFGFFYQLTYQKNRTADYLKSFWEPIIEEATTDRSAFRKIWPAHIEYRNNPPLRNFSGWHFHRPPDFSAEEKRVADLYRISDLLAAYLASRLEFSDKIAAYLSEGQHLVTAQDRRIIDAGEDQIPGTADDIVLTPLF